MAGRRTTYILVPVVLGIWGLIGWKIWKGLQGDDGSGATVAVAAATHKAAQVPDSFALVADYRDPFLGKAAVVINPAPKPQAGGERKTVAAVTKPQPPVNEWPALSYYGFVGKSGGGGTGFLSVNGASHFVSSGQQLAGLSIGRVWKDSVEVVRGKERRIVRK